MNNVTPPTTNVQPQGKRLHRRHGLRSCPEYQIWKGMKARCSNPRHASYHNYGGRGIKVCERWLASFSDFLFDLGPRPSSNHWIERRNNDGDYCPENCEWKTRSEQARNMRKTKLVTFQGRTVPLVTLCEELGLNEKTVRTRMRQMKWSLEEALTCRGDARHIRFSNPWHKRTTS
jgi:hypothetical protein